MISTVLRLSSCCTDKFHSCHSGALIVPTSAPNAGGLKATPAGKLLDMVLKLTVILKAAADACQVVGAPAGANGSTPALEGEFRTLKATVDGGFASRLSTRPAAGLS